MRRARLHLGPLWPYAVLIGIPAVGFILPDLLGGHLLLTGDNLQQNYPLHVLVGSMLRKGQLPFWNNYMFSGTPLLAGFNAGAFYPLVGLFVILPDRTAWVATEVVLFSCVAVGMYLFLRALALSTVACVLGALTFAFSGVVLSQVNHVDMTEGFASIPFMLLAVLHIVRDGRWRWSIVLGISFALVIFGGAPEAMLDEALLVIAYAAVTAGFDRLRWWRVLTRCGAGAALALSLAAVQWLPGIAAISNSQRSGFGGSFAATGSFPPSYGLLSVVPYLYGGYGALGERTFFGHYNLPEVGTYVGILPIVALVSLWRPGWPSRLARRERLTWYVVGLIGLLLALGANTPLEHVFNAIPLYGHQRLQSRNLIDVSVAVCVLFAGWLDRRPDSGKACVSFDRWVGFIPLGVVLAVGGWAIFDPKALITLAMGSGSASEVHTVREATIFALGFCLGAGVIVWLRSLVPNRYWLGAVTVFVLIDLALAAGTSQLLDNPSNAVVAGDTPIESYIAAHSAPGSRFDVYDPQGYANGPNDYGTGLPDLNVLARLPSVGGYASIVSGSYNTLTLTHQSGDLNVPLLNSREFADLDLQDILTPPEYFLLPLRSVPNSLDGVEQESEDRGEDPVLPMGIDANLTGNGYTLYPAPRGTLGAGQSNAWFFGTTLSPSQASILLTSPTTGGQIRFGKVGLAGTRWGPVVTFASGEQHVDGTLPPGKATGLAVQVISGRLPPHQAVLLLGAHAYELDGSLSSSLRPGVWRAEGSVDDYSLFVRARRAAPLHAATGSVGAVPHIDVLSESANEEAIRVRTSSSMLLVRDVSWDRGWHASVTDDGGASRSVPVRKSGLVQQVRLPAGTDVVTFTYSPPHWLVASALTEGSALLLVIVLVDALLRRRGVRGRGGRGSRRFGRREARAMSTPAWSLRPAPPPQVD